MPTVRLLGALVVGVSTFAAAVPHASAQTIGVSSDGREFHATSSTKRMMKGVPPRATESAADDALAAMKSAPESSEEVWRLWSLRPAQGSIGQESIIGRDDRKRVRNTRAYPNSAIVLVTFEDQRCTGWMISPDTVATAGHCVHSGGNRGRWFNTGSYRIYPGRDGGKSPFGSCRARTLYSNTGWTTRGASKSDYGAIKLNCKIGNRTGTFGYAWSPGSLNGTKVDVTGYPGDKPLTMWTAAGRVTASNASEVFYPNDTIGGQSGAPVYGQQKGCGYCGYAIHAYGTYGRPPYRTNNHGTRITKQVFQQLQAWSKD